VKEEPDRTVDADRVTMQVDLDGGDDLEAGTDAWRNLVAIQYLTSLIDSGAITVTRIGSILGLVCRDARRRGASP
jgi:hypothetical protein